jgi:8-amino-7-oxononanoate synthase
MSELDILLERHLAKRKADGLLRSLKLPPGSIDFCSNDYLGLAKSQELNDAIREELQSFPKANGSTGSRLLTGNTERHEETEHFLSNIFGSEATLVFNSGYTANLAVLSSLPQRGDTIVYDELAHACIKEGARLSLANRYSFKHNDVGALEEKLRRASGNIFIAVESVYSMDGDFAPLKEIIAMAEKYKANIILDEAHSTGVFGVDGAGLAVDRQLHKKIAVRIYTFGKAMGIHGACVAGSSKLKQFLINFARPFIYTTAPDHHLLASIVSSFRYLSKNISLQCIIQEKCKLFSTQFQLPNTNQHPVKTFIVRGNDVARAAAEKLNNEGFDVRPILSPTVPAGTERLRVCLHTFNHDSEIVELCNSLRAIGDKYHAQ